MSVTSKRAVSAPIMGRTESAAEKLISASLSAQAGLVGHDATRAIPAVAESPIPVLAPRNRTPDPRSTRARTRLQRD